MPNESGNEANDEANEEEGADLEQVLQELDSCASRTDPVTVGDVVDAVGSRTFAPLILIPGLVMLAPGVGDIPGVPVLMGALVILVLVQMLMSRRHIWLPEWLERRSVRAALVHKTAGWLRKPARFTDRWTRPRYQWALHHGGFVVIAMACILVAMATPVMEVVPFSANLAGLVITAFGLALIAQDGLIAMIAMALALGTGGFLVYQLL